MMFLTSKYIKIFIQMCKFCVRKDLVLLMSKISDTRHDIKDLKELLNINMSNI